MAQASVFKKYISIDIEASGPTPGKYSMLSIGACIVGDTATNFYRELKPLNLNYEPSAIRVASLGLDCLTGFAGQPALDARSESFNPRLVLEILKIEGEAPQKAMAEFADWIKSSTAGFHPVEAAAPIKFDGMFTAWYFDNFYRGQNPFGHSGEDMNSLFRGIEGTIYTSMKNLGVPDTRKRPHNALNDAIYQAQQFELVLSRLKTD